MLSLFWPIWDPAYVFSNELSFCQLKESFAPFEVALVKGGIPSES